MTWKKEIKKSWAASKIVTALALGTLLCVLVAPKAVYALELEDEDVFQDSTNTMDSLPADETQQIIQQEDTSSDLRSEVADYIRIDSETTYSQQEDLYYKYVEGYGDRALISNVLDGMYTRSAVNITVASGIVYTMYKNGVAESGMDISEITEPGSYALAMYDGSSNPVTPLSFTILGEYTNISRVDLPDTCDLVNVVYEGEEVVTNSNSVELQNEGHFTINFMCGLAGRTYSIDFVRDVTPPVLELKEVNEKGYASSAVSIADLEEGAQCLILRNDEVEPVTALLKDSGRYQIVVTDAAGNSNEYNFTIRTYFNYVSITFLLVFTALLAGLVTYVVIAKKRLRVR